MKRLLVFALFACALTAWGQSAVIHGNGDIRLQHNPPSCSFNSVYVDDLTGNIYLSKGSPCAWVAGTGGSSSGQSVVITDAPYNAKCDGHTDDHDAIQQALTDMGAVNGAVNWPASTVQNQQQCNTTRGFTLAEKTSVTINAVLGYLGYTGGTDNIFNMPSGATIAEGLVVNGLNVDLTGSTGTPTLFYCDSCFMTWGLDAGSLVQVISAEGGPTGWYAFRENPSGIGGNIKIGVVDTDGLMDLSGRGTDLTIEQMDMLPPHSGGAPNTIVFKFSPYESQGVIKFLGLNWGSDLSTAATNSCMIDLIPYAIGDNAVSTMTMLSGYADILGGAGDVRHVFCNTATSPYTPVFNGSFALDGTLSNLFAGTPPNGLFTAYSTTFTAQVNLGLITSGFAYSAAGSAIPSCTAALKTLNANVSDATTPTFLGTYASGGAVVSPVTCNGTNWLTY